MSSPGGAGPVYPLAPGVGVQPGQGVAGGPAAGCGVW